MKVTILRNIGLADLKKVGAEGRTDLVEGAELDVPNDIAEKLIELKVAELPTMKGVQTAKSAPPEAAADSPVADVAAHDAITQISTMRSKEKLQAIVDGDQRSTVVEAAKKRLGEV